MAAIRSLTEGYRRIADPGAGVADAMAWYAGPRAGPGGAQPSPPAFERPAAGRVSNVPRRAPAGSPRYSAPYAAREEAAAYAPSAGRALINPAVEGWPSPGRAWSARELGEYAGRAYEPPIRAPPGGGGGLGGGGGGLAAYGVDGGGGGGRVDVTSVLGQLQARVRTLEGQIMPLQQVRACFVKLPLRNAPDASAVPLATNSRFSTLGGAGDAGPGEPGRRGDQGGAAAAAAGGALAEGRVGARARPRARSHADQA